jgi:fimbrial isopeptide formation D2 family protein/LPXTG-motif cell wall-anchored protein
MKKKLSSIVSLLFILCTVVVGGAQIVKAENSAIRPDIGGTGSLTIHKHWAEDTSQIGDEGNGQEQTVSNPPVESVAFNIYELTPVDDAPTTPPSEKDGAVYSLNTAKTELTITFGGKTHKYTMGGKQTGTTNATGEYKYENLEGFYYVEEDLANSNPKVNGKDVTIATPAKPFVVSVPMTNPTGDGWFKDVHVYPKNQGMTPEKTVNNGGKNSVNIGDRLDFGIKVAIPSDIGEDEYKVFNIHDTLDEALTYVGDTVKVYVYKFESGAWQKKEMTTGFTGNFAEGAHPISVVFTEEGRKELAQLMSVDGGSYTHVGIEFGATVNEKVLEKPNYTVKNKGDIEWNNTPGDETIKTPTPETETNTGDIVIDKKDQAGADLSGAEFQIADSDADAKDGNKYIKVKVDDAGLITDLVYPGDADYDSADALNWVVRPHAASGDLGKKGDTFYASKFQGLQTHSGTDDEKVAMDYYVVETKTPNCYNLLDEPAKVTFADEEKTTHIVSKEIVNSKGFKLPNTGSLGMILLTVIGIILIGLAIVMFIPKKRRS